MSPETRREIERIFNEVVDEPPARQAELIEQRCGSRHALRSEVQRLLRASDEVMGDFMHVATLDASGPDGSPGADGGLKLDRVGRYRIESQIGEGGMGLVYAARQESPDRSVALKLLRPGLVSPALVRRFQHEVQALAALQHPNIAHIYEAGTIELAAGDGCFEQPYFAMELIRGEPLTEYVRRRSLGIRQRLALLIEVCDAVQHAHQKGVIHRDLKPANILVDGSGRPKVLDFGVARVATADIEARTQHTGAGQLIGTLAYMSPEQLAGEPQQVDTRSDVYSLGVIAFELLAGRLPYDLSGKPLGASVRMLTENPPARLGAVSRICRGDLDAIVAKALERDPVRRYPSAHALSEDMRRHLRREPIAARPPSAVYQLGRFAQRNKALVGGLAAALVALILGLVGTGYGLHRAATALAQANERSQQLDDVVRFQASQLGEIDVSRMGVWLRSALLDEIRSAKQRSRLEPDAIEAQMSATDDLLDGASFTNLALRMLDQNVFERALNAIGAEFPDQPLVRARLLHTTADTLRNLGMLERAIVPQEEVLRIWRETLGSDDQNTLGALNNLGHILHRIGRLEEAEAHLREAVDGYRRTLGEDHPETLSATSNLGALLRDLRRTEEAEQLYIETMERRERLLGRDHPSTLTSYNNVGTMLASQGKRAESLAYHRSALEGRRRALGAENPDTLTSIMNLGITLVLQGNFEEAEPLLEEAVQTSRRVLGDDHPDTLAALFYLGTLYRQQSRLADAEPLLRQSLEGRRRTLGRDHTKSIQSLGMLAALLRDQGRLEEAEALYLEALERNQRVYGDDHPGTIAWVNCLGQVYLDRNMPGEAEEFFRSALEGRRRVLGEQHPETLPSLNNVASALMAQDKLDQAEPILDEALHVSRRVLGDDHPNTLGIMSNLGRLLRRLDRLDAAEALGAEAVRRARQKLPADHASIAIFLAEHGVTLAAQERFADAEAELLEAYEVFVGSLGAAHVRTTQCVESLVRMYDAWHAAEPLAGHHKRAEVWRTTLTGTDISP